MHGFIAVYYRELLILRRRFFKIIASMSVSPLLYLIAFGYAMGGSVVINGHTYTEFLIPGLIAMSSMTRAFAIGSEINIARFYWHIFEEFQASPISNWSYVLGETMAGVTRAMISAMIIVLLGLGFGVSLLYESPFFWFSIFLNAFVFSSFAVALAMLVKSHADQAMLTNFVITPMGFLGGTFFPVEKLPLWAQKFICMLPITHASKLIRASVFGKPISYFSLLYLLIVGIISFGIAVSVVDKAKD